MTDLFEQWDMAKQPSRQAAAAPAQPHNPFAPRPSVPQNTPSVNPINTKPKATSTNPFAASKREPDVSSLFREVHIPSEEMKPPQPPQPTVAKEVEGKIFSLLQDPSFTRMKRQLGGKIETMAVGSNHIILALDQLRILRWTLGEGEPVEMELKKDGPRSDSIRKIVTDGHGFHTLVFMQSGDMHYIHSTQSKPKRVWKQSPYVIESVAFDEANVSETVTRSILMGTSDGRLLETSIDSSGKEKPVVEHFQLDQKTAITGLHMEVVRGRHDDRIFVSAATSQPTRLYSFLGGPTLEALFAQAQREGLTFNELGVTMKRAELHCFPCRSRGKQGHTSTLFALLTEHGVYHGSFQLSASHVNPSDVVLEPGLLPFVSTENDMLHQPVPLTMNMTEFHFLFLYRDSLRIVNRLSGELVQEIDLREQVQGITRDYEHGTLWLYTSQALHQITVDREQRDIWKLYLNKGLRGDVRKFDDAFQFASTAEEKAQIREKQATFHFDKGDYQTAAKLYARTEGIQFEAVALKFMSMESDASREALEILLEEKLNNPSEEKVQKTMLATWLTELYLQSFLDLEDVHDGSAEQRRHRLEEKLHTFLDEQRDTLDRDTTFQLLTSHGHDLAVLHYASLIEDYEKVVAHLISEENYLEALDTLDKADFRKAKGLFYRFSSIFMEKVPRETVSVWKQKPDLSPTKLLPALVLYCQNRVEADTKARTRPMEHHALDYLEHCIEAHEHVDKAIYNLVLLFHAQRVDDDRVLRFIESCPPGVLDLQYALRVCLQHGKTAACVHIYSAMNLFEEAVKLALSDDMYMAKRNADLPLDEDTRKRLWLLIAKHIIETSSDPQDGLAVLDECDLLGIDDILPFFSDFTRIDDFRTKIVDSLERYDDRIEALREEMEEYTTSEQEIFKEIDKLQERKFQVPGRTECSLSGRSILTGPFYIFPSGYAYLADELYSHVYPHLTPHQQARARELKSFLDKGDALMPDRENLQIELDDLIAAECPLTGSIMIESVDEPLLSEEDLDREKASWEI